jgi:fatty acid CoA ligase FadD9
MTEPSVGPGSPVPARTLNQAQLFAAMARVGLAASLDGGLPTRAADADCDAPFRARARSVGGVITLELQVMADHAVIWLAPVEVDGNHWRDSWVVELVRPDDAESSEQRWVLTAGGDPARVHDARRTPIVARLLLRRRRLVLGLDGDVDEVVPIADAAFNRPTRQSSVLPRPGPLTWAAPTAAQQAPYWEIDLGRAMYIASMRVRLAGVPEHARVMVEAFPFAMRDGRAPTGCFSWTTVANAADGQPAFDISADTVARTVRITLARPGGLPLSLAVTALEVLAAPVFAGSLPATMRRAFALHRRRPLFLARRPDGSYTPAETYGEVWSRSMALARALARRLEPPTRDDERVFLGIATRNRAEWVVADLAALTRGYVVVPLPPGESDEKLAQMLELARPDALVCERADVARLAEIGGARGRRLLVVCDGASSLPAAVPSIHFDDLVAEGGAGPVPPPAERAEDDLCTVLFTSGSTGTPKGAMHSYASFYSMVARSGAGQHPRHLSSQPLAHLNERLYLPWVLVHGGEIAFSRDGTELMDELRSFEPTAVASVPRLFEVLYASYQRRVAAAVAAEPAISRTAHEARALAEARAAFGSRLLWVAVGSAPVSPEVLGFLHRCFADLHVVHGYGTTETGAIVIDGMTPSNVEVKLVSLPDSAAHPAGRERGRDRGEIWVRSPSAIMGYLGDAAVALDSDGFFPTGDLGERAADGTIGVVGRLRNAVKLAQGEFVTAESIETALGTAPVADRVYAHVEAGAPGVAVLVFPDADALARLLGCPDADLATLARRADAASAVLAELRAHGRRAGLASWELPRGVLLEATVPSTDNSLLSHVGKLARGVITARYGARLRGLARGTVAGANLERDGGNDNIGAVAARIAAIASGVVGRPVNPREPPAELGVDSLATAELLAVLNEALGREVPLHAWFSAPSIEQLADSLGGSAAPVTAPAADLVAEDLAAGLAGDPAAAAPCRLPLQEVLLTGSTGLLGAHLLEAVLARTSLRITCLVRAPDNRAGMARLREVLAAYAIPQAGLDSGRVRVMAGDLAAPTLGLADAQYRDLRVAVDAIVHAGAEVNWLAPHSALRGPNVHGTRAVLELAAMDRRRPVHFVSTISTAPPGGDEDTMLPLEAAPRSPYGLTKWIAEQHVRRAGAAGLPVAVYRPGMIAAHSRRGHGNPDDFLHRYLVGAAELGLYLDLDAPLDMTPVDYVADSIGALLAAHPLGGGATYHLTNVEQSPSYAEFGRALRRAGVAVAPANYADFRAAMLDARQTRLRALAPYFPADGSGLAMGPWPCARTLTAVEVLGIVRPRIDDAMVTRVVDSLRARGLLAAAGGTTR